MTKKIVYCIDASRSGTVRTLTVGKEYEVLEEILEGRGGHRYVLINDHGNKEEYYQYRFTTENPNKKMMKPTSLPVSPAFIIDAHKAACSTWRKKLEDRYPELFRPTQTFKTGDKIQFPHTTIKEFANTTYILAETAVRQMVLINLQNGHRWTEQVIVSNSSAITPAELRLLCGSNPLDKVVVNGAPITKPAEPTVEKTLTASVKDIEDAYKAAAGMPLQKKIKDYFPEVFGPELFDMYEKSCTISAINGNNVFCGMSAAPDGLHSKCLMVDQNYGEKPEVTEHHSGGKSYWVVTFPKK